MTGRQYRLNFIGGICLDNHKIIYENPDKVDAGSIKYFLAKLRKKYQDNRQIHVIWDNAGYHKSHEVQAYARKLYINLHYSPPYSPNLNPIERLWKIMHEQISYNKYYGKFTEFAEAALKFFKHIGRNKKILRARITDNFQILSAPRLAV